MKKISKFFVLFIMAALFSTWHITFASASIENDNSQIVRLEDGSYIVITIEDVQSSNSFAFFAGKQIKSGTKKYDYYNSSDELVLVFRVHGTFEYNGVSASATGATYSYDIYSSEWFFVDGSATCSKATATATGRFKRSLFPSSVSASLTCSPTGILS